MGMGVWRIGMLTGFVLIVTGVFNPAGWWCMDKTFPNLADSTKEGTMADDERIRALVERFADAWNSGDVETAVTVYTDPHVDLNAPEAIESRAVTLAKWRRFCEHFDTRISVSSDEVIVAGDWAFQRGQFEQTVSPKQGGPTKVVTRRYVEILRRGPENGWLVFWGMDGPIAGESWNDESVISGR